MPYCVVAHYLVHENAPHPALVDPPNPPPPSLPLCCPWRQVDILNTEAHNSQLSEAQSLLESELSDKEAAIAKYESSMKKRADEIERKTREIDTLNRKLERIIAARPGACVWRGRHACLGGGWTGAPAAVTCHIRSVS